MLWGNGLLMACCGFYLLWWILALKPAGAIKGMRSVWLLIPAVVFDWQQYISSCAAIQAPNRRGHSFRGYLS